MLEHCWWLSCYAGCGDSEVAIPYGRRHHAAQQSSHIQWQLAMWIPASGSCNPAAAAYGPLTRTCPRHATCSIMVASGTVTFAMLIGLHSLPISPYRHTSALDDCHFTSKDLRNCFTVTTLTCGFKCQAVCMHSRSKGNQNYQPAAWQLQQSRLCCGSVI